MDSKKTYYINVADGQISQLQTASSWNFKIEATDDEIIKLRELFDNVHASDWKGFYRAHTPYIQYHYDRENDAVDNTNKQIYQMIYELGDDEARELIRTEGILSKLEQQE
ncbi:hydrolase [Metabacillus malikii]|uniref:Hydrolase n=1 Tax=Metabacillus malikii TaxID=1504265 RepID=A0ABT9ZFS0_9BACI|nr:hydrolase [Metabacillus malikii]MDQ0231133.1 hypothetical protein [Metabacillus malikii]